ncbi:MAG: efflux RND transporter periplasmic adaptor subunit, partial [Pseudomonadota bacterium]
MKILYKFGLLFSLIFLISIVLTTGCSKKKEVVETEEIRPVKTIIVKTPDIGGIRNFPARVDANRKAEIAFRVAGKVEQLLVKEGDEIKKGDTIARLDPTDFKIALSNKKALYTRAKKDYMRGKDLVKDGNISRMDYDKLEAIYHSNQADYNLAKQQLAYTDLKA